MTSPLTWQARARAALEDLAASGRPFTSDDLIDVVGWPDGEHTPNGANSAVGSAFRSAKAAGLIVTEGRVRQSRQPHRKGGAVRIWHGVHVDRLL